MKEYFSNQVKNPQDVGELPQYIPHPAFIYEKKEDEKSKSDILTLAENSYQILENLPENDSGEENIVVGYLSASRTKGKQKDLSKYANAVLLDENIYCELKKKSDEKIVGYLKAIGENKYVAVTRERSFLPILWFLPLLLLLLLLFIPHKPTPIFTPDKVTSGAITPIEIGELAPDYFNIKINATPILEDGKLNIRIENSVRNIYDCYVEVFIRDEFIYKSPVISPDQSLEFATIAVDFTHGEYDGMAVFHYLDGEEELAVTSSVKLVVGVR